LAPPPPPGSRGFTATTGRSAGERRLGTQCLRFLPRHAPCWDRVAVRAQVNGPRYRRSPSHVPCKSSRPGSRRLYAGHHLANKRVARQAPPEGVLRTPGFDATFVITTLRQRRPSGLSRPDASGTSSWSPPDASCAPFPSRSPRRSSTNAAEGGLAPAPAGRRWRATTSISHTAPHLKGSPT
jgi:hypothetical protein